MTFNRSRGCAFIGQSYGQEGYDRTPAYAAFQEAIRRAIVSDAAGIQASIGGSPTLAAGHIFQRRGYAVDGSAVLEPHKGASTNYWLESDGTTAGPRLTAAVDAITVLAQKPLIFMHSHGEQDAGFTATSAIANDVAAGMLEIYSQVRAVAGSSSLPVFVDLIGPRFAAQEFNEYRLRDAMVAMIAGASRVYRGAEKYALLLDKTTHPSTDFGYACLGAWTGRKVAAWLLDTMTTNPAPGPSISSAVRTGNSVAVTIATPAGGSLVKPATPDFFGLFDASDNRIPVTGYSWSGDTLTITGATQPARFRYPARIDGAANVANVVRLANPSDPLFAGEPGLPLESAPTVVL